ncbi:hypothetical protein [Phytomonospora endophytica]|uniref:Uncharacterized protein n=1 Tax=Phytomonospora endophytica TaxID=714109 RepID=A0A841FTM3_9ACTN|nr:hypothetical protein [Phytomonospora endophytica]MBB6035879.1 hypothetical protein [Phytomonospora endophytica]GIG71126.1 hypothetical protein Pen01_74210 [Phytomonospora endophytica]
MPLNRLTAYAGYACAFLLLFNVTRRAGVLPENAFTHAVAPFAVLAGLFAVTGLYRLVRPAAGTLGLVGYVLNAAGLAGAFAVEYTLHFVFPGLTEETRSHLLDGGTGRAFLATAVVLIAGVLTFSAAALRSRVLPTGAVVLYAVGMVPGSLRGAVPVAVYLGGLVLAAAGVVWMAHRARTTPDAVPQPA